MLSKEDDHSNVVSVPPVFSDPGFMDYILDFCIELPFTSGEF